MAEVSRCARDERGATAHLVAHLAEFDARRLHLGAGFSSLFAYCCEVLRLSGSATYNRIEADRAARRFPVILDRLAEGSFNLTTVRLLAPHLRTTTMRSSSRLRGTAFVGTGGHRCSERAFIEYHHVMPYGVGGDATIANIQLRCRAHNGHESQLFYGSNRLHGGADVARECRSNYAVSCGFALVPGRVGSLPVEDNSMRTP